MKPKASQMHLKDAYENDQVPDWWNAEPTHEQLMAEEISNQRHEEHMANLPESSKWVANAAKKGPKPF
jgi:hypothetical protein